MSRTAHSRAHQPPPPARPGLTACAQALQACSAVPAEQAAASAHLQAQLQYRLGKHQAAMQLYDHLASQRVRPRLRCRALAGSQGTTPDAPAWQGAVQEVGANLAAAYVAAGRSADLPRAAAALKLAPRASFEVAFNFGCALLAQGDLEAARQQLLHAQRLGEPTAAAAGAGVSCPSHGGGSTRRACSVLLPHRCCCLCCLTPARLWLPAAPQKLAGRLKSA